ncbi:MAG: lactate utilization protein LutB domain-containing protein, partial [Chloroflexota bacterium]
LKWDAAIKSWEYVNLSAPIFEWGGKAARLGLKLGADKLVPNPLGEWKKYRDFPDFAPKSFRQQWRDRQKGE